jgi:hypothetical protein
MARLSFFQTRSTKKLFSSSSVYAPTQFAFSERVSLSHDYHVLLLTEWLWEWKPSETFHYYIARRIGPNAARDSLI